jgi:hypothetical protein
MGRIEGIQARCQGLGPVGSKPSIPRDGPVTSGVCSPFPQEVWRSISRNGIGRKWEVGVVSCKEEVFLNKVIQEGLYSCSFHLWYCVPLHNTTGPSPRSFSHYPKLFTQTLHLISNFSLRI